MVPAARYSGASGMWNRLVRMGLTGVAVCEVVPYIAGIVGWRP